MRVVQVVGINYRPEETGIAPYTSRMAEHLAARGFAVRVWTGIPHYPSWTVNRQYARHWRVEERLNGVEVRRFRHFVPERQSAWRRALYEATFLLNGLLASAARPDLVLGVVPSLGGGVLAARVARRHRAPLGIIVQDLMGAAARQSGMPGGAAVASLTQTAERFVLRQARAVGVVSESFREPLVAMGIPADRIVGLPNWTHIDAPRRGRDETRRRLGWAAGQVIVLHAGNMGLKQALENVLATARLVEGSGGDVRFVLMGDGSQRVGLMRLAEGCRTIEFLAPVAAADFPDVLAAADVLLVNERRTVVDMSLPSKLTSYFAAGRPVVAATPETSGTAREVTRAGAGLIVPPEDPRALLSAVERLAAAPGLREALGAAGAAYAADRLGADAALARLERFVAALLSASRPGDHAAPARA